MLGRLAVGFSFLAVVLVFRSVTGAEVSKMTHTFKKVGDLEIKADVYQPEQAKGDGKRPVVVWIHGGALINGHRESVPKWLLDGSLKRRLGCRLDRLSARAGDTAVSHHRRPGRRLPLDC